MSVVVQVAHSVNGVESSCMKLSVINFIIMHRNSIGLVLCLCLILTGLFQLFTIAFRKINSLLSVRYLLKNLAQDQ